MSAPLPRVAAVVVNYNGKEVTLQAVESLRQMTYPDFDLVVLDNASTDGSPEALAAAYPDLRQVRVEVNRGAPRATPRASAGPSRTATTTCSCSTTTSRSSRTC